jgi:hypothetical protein
MARLQTALLRQLDTLAQKAIQGTLVEVYLRCGTPSCGCHQDPARRHGPHLYLKFKDADGRSTSLYIPRSHAREARRAVEAWGRMWQVMLRLGQRNRRALARRMRRKG